jgi:hypothetical protein
MPSLVDSMAAAIGARARVAATTQADRAAISIGLADGTALVIEASPPRTEARLEDYVVSAAFSTAQLVADVTAVRADTRLTAVGQAEKLRAAREGTLRLLAVSYAGVMAIAAEADTTEARRYAAPGVPTTPTELAVAVARHREIRDRVRALSAAHATNLIDRACDDAHAGDAEAREFLTAVLTPTFGDLDVAREFAQTTWRRLVNLDDPGGLIALQELRAGIEWAQRALFVVAATAQRYCDFPRDTVADVVLATGGGAVFGLTVQDLAGAQRRADFAKARGRS